MKLSERLKTIILGIWWLEEVLNRFYPFLAASPINIGKMHSEFVKIYPRVIEIFGTSQPYALRSSYSISGSLKSYDSISITLR